MDFFFSEPYVQNHMYAISIYKINILCMLNISTK